MISEESVLFFSWLSEENTVRVIVVVSLFRSLIIQPRKITLNYYLNVILYLLCIYVHFHKHTHTHMSTWLVSGSHSISLLFPLNSIWFLDHICYIVHMYILWFIVSIIFIVILSISFIAQSSVPYIVKLYQHFCLFA